jgi:GntR family transcriptional regulator, transcriptional repressor for pyruvate dehydrogenase complex
MAETPHPFKPVHKRRAAEQVAEQIREQILGGAFQPGQRLPPERDLAAFFGVNRTTLREALRSLEQQRLLDIHHGDGATVLDVKLHAGLDLLAYLVKVDGQLDLSILSEILEARRAFGLELARLAALRATEDDLAQLERILDQLAAPEVSIERVQDLDWSFFEALARAAHNRVFSLILNTIRPIYMEHRSLFVPLYRGPEPILRLHRALLGHLRRHDAQAAAGTVVQFLDLAFPSFDAPAELPAAHPMPEETPQAPPVTPAPAPAAKPPVVRRVSPSAEPWLERNWP